MDSQCRNVFPTHPYIIRTSAPIHVLIYKSDEGDKGHPYRRLNQFHSMPCNLLTAHPVNDIKYAVEVKLVKVKLKILGHLFNISMVYQNLTNNRNNNNQSQFLYYSCRNYFYSYSISQEAEGKAFCFVVMKEVAEKQGSYLRINLYQEISTQHQVDISLCLHYEKKSKVSHSTNGM